MLYANKFFKTKEEAVAFQHKNGGAMYSNLPKSRTRKDYLAEACIAEMTEAQCEAKPYCVAWNVVPEGPIVDDRIREPDPVSCDTCTDKGHCPEYVSGAPCVNRRG